MSETPPRHPQVPAEAIWRPELERWELCALDGSGAKQGECRQFRSDGSLALRCDFVAGLEEGAFSTFHPSGEVARSGHFMRGQMQGDVVTRVASAGEGEPLRSCCVPESAVEMRSLYDGGQMMYERFYDGQGHLLLSDGSHSPERPAALPAHADYEEGTGRWMVPPLPSSGDKVVRFYRHDGGLDEAATIENGWKTAAERFALDGSVKSREHFAQDGRREGSHLRRFIEGEASPYRDSRITEERGSFIGDRPAGRWTFHDSRGHVLHTIEHGDPSTEAALAGAAQVFGDETRTTEAWLAFADQLISERRVALGLAAAARAAALAGDASHLADRLAAHTVALADGPAEALVTAVRERAEKSADASTNLPAEMLSALVAGGDAAEILRTLSGIYRPAARASFELAEASLLLAPDRPAGFMTRALARLELGDDGGALADARRLEPASPESAAFLRDYIKVLFPEWAFAPARESFGAPVAPVDGMPDEPGQPIEAIVRVMQVYATRLASLRAAVIKRAPRRERAAWLPPALPELLPDGPVPLARFEATIIDETEAGPEEVAVVIDESIDCGGDGEGVGVPALMQLARGQWAALTWLSWAVGLSRVALPSTIAPPAAFSAAAVAGLTRLFRVQDALATGGLRSRMAEAPSFAWQGIDIDELPRPMAEVAETEARELRCLYLWLLSPENHSPFQSDLRQAC